MDKITAAVEKHKPKSKKIPLPQPRPRSMIPEPADDAAGFSPFERGSKPIDAGSANAAAAGTQAAEAYKTRFEAALASWPAGGTDAVKYLDASGPAAAAGAKVAESYRTSMETGLQNVDAVLRAAVQRWNGILGGVSASPTISPKINSPTGGTAPSPAPSGRSATLSSLQAREAAMADVNFYTG